MGSGSRLGDLLGALLFSSFPPLRSEFLQSWLRYHSLKHLITYNDLEGCLSPRRETFLFPVPSEVGCLKSNEIELKMKQPGV